MRYKARTVEGINALATRLTNVFPDDALDIREAFYEKYNTENASRYCSRVPVFVVITSRKDCDYESMLLNLLQVKTIQKLQIHGNEATYLSEFVLCGVSLAALLEYSTFAVSEGVLWYLYRLQQCGVFIQEVPSLRGRSLDSSVPLVSLYMPALTSLLGLAPGNDASPLAETLVIFIGMPWERTLAVIEAAADSPALKRLVVSISYSYSPSLRNACYKLMQLVFRGSVRGIEELVLFGPQLDELALDAAERSMTIESTMLTANPGFSPPPSITASYVTCSEFLLHDPYNAFEVFFRPQSPMVVPVIGDHLNRSTSVWWKVHLNGWGEAWAKKESSPVTTVNTPQRFPLREPRLCLPIREVVEDSIANIVRFVKTVGHTVVSLQLEPDDRLCMDSWWCDLLSNCPHLTSIQAPYVHFNNMESFTLAVESNKFERVEVGVVTNTLSAITFMKILPDENNPWAKTLRVLTIAFSIETEDEYEIVHEVTRMLEKNRRLHTVTLAFECWQDLFYDRMAADLSRTKPDRMIAVGPFPSRKKLALLSVFHPSNQTKEETSFGCLRRIPIDARILSKVFEFAAPAQKRCVTFFYHIHEA